GGVLVIAVAGAGRGTAGLLGPVGVDDAVPVAVEVVEVVTVRVDAVPAGVGGAGVDLVVAVVAVRVVGHVAFGRVGGADRLGRVAEAVRVVVGEPPGRGAAGLADEAQGGIAGLVVP